MKKAIALLLAVLMCVALFAACGQEPAPAPGPDAEKPSSGAQDFTGQMTTGDEHEITEETKYAEKINIITDNTKIALLDPQTPTGATSSSLTAFKIIYSRLMKQVGTEYVPELAVSVDTEDAQHFAVKLRDDVYFHNGEKMTAYDVEFTMNRAKESGAGSPVYSKWSCIDTIEVIDDTTLNITLSAVNVDFIKDLAYSACGILCKKAVEADAEKGTWIGTGPYKVTDFVSNESVELEAFDKYWGEAPITKYLSMKYVAEETARYIALQNKEADVVFSINAINFPEIEANPEYRAYAYVVHNAMFLAFNVTKPIMNDINFRYAVAYAMNRDELIIGARNGYAEKPANGAFWGYGTEYMDETIPVIEHDLEKAKEYLAKSSYNGETIEIAAALNEAVLSAQMLQEQLGAIGIKVEVYQTDTTGMNAYAKWGENQAQMVAYTGGWSTLASSCRPWYYPGNSYNRAAYDNPVVNELLDRAPTVVDEAEREEIYKEVQRITAADLPFITMFHIKHLIAADKNVGGIVVSSDSCQDFSMVYKIIE